MAYLSSYKPLTSFLDLKTIRTEPKIMVHSLIKDNIVSPNFSNFLEFKGISSAKVTHIPPPA